MTAPALFENIVATGKEYKDLPVPKDPYFVIAEEGTFMHRSTALGRVLVPSKPKRIGSVEHKNGVFYWDAPTIPGDIIAQATDFFRRIWQKHKTEAEVIITYHTEQKRFRLFVPVQRTSHSGVKSIYDPSHIQKGWLVVGTLHSHCNFSAFHSGTDSADASDMDGVHFTIGMLDNETPEIVAMVAMNGKEFHYEKPEQIADIQFTGATAPEWWDDFVYPGQTPTNKPKGFKQTSDADWNEFKGLHVGVTRKTTSLTNYQQRTSPNNWHGDDWGSDWRSQYGDYGTWYSPEQGYYRGPSKPLTESKDFNNRQRKDTIVWRQRRSGEDLKPFNLRTQKWIGDDTDEEQTLLDFVIDSGIDADVIPDDDITMLALQDRKGLMKYLLGKINTISDLAELLGYDISYKVAVKETPIVNGQTELFSEDTSK